MSNTIGITPTSSPIHTPSVARGDALTPGRYYTLELIGGKGHQSAVSGFTYLATDFVDKDSGRLLVNSGNGEHFFTDESDIYSF